MLAGLQSKQDFSVNVLRRRDLLAAIKQEHPQKEGVLVLFAGLESDSTTFKQESAFFYYTGLQEPGLVLVVDLQGKSTLYVPNYGPHRAQWMHSALELTQKNAANIGINEIKDLGELCAGYQLYPFAPQSEYALLLHDLRAIVQAHKTIFTLSPSSPRGYAEQRHRIQYLEEFLPGFKKQIIDVSLLVARQRCTKDMREIEALYTAVEITLLAQEAAARAIQADQLECEVQASLEYIFTAAGATPAFPSIVGSGKNSTVLHYTANSEPLKNGDVVVIDIGAQYNQYCADVTRTYPVSGTFTKRQRELYMLVLETQEYIASIAKPGLWLNNKEHPEKSLHHLAKAYFAKRGYDQYFMHGIGHYLGLDVHDVGDYTRPLQEGDVFTIEPGLYIAAENIGIRIEDDYWMVKDGVVCLTEQLVKKPEDIEALMRATEDDSEMVLEEDEYDSDAFGDLDDDEAPEA